MTEASDLTNPRERLRETIKSRGIVYRKNRPRSIRSRTGQGLAWLVDLRQIFLDPVVLDDYATLFWDHFEEKLPLQVGGPAMGAIPFVTALLLKAHQRGLDVNGFIVRKERKTSGQCKQIEGELNDAPIVIVDDVLNSGSSIERVRAALDQEGREAAHIFAIINFLRSSPYQEALQEQGIETSSLFTAEDFDLPTSSSLTWDEPSLSIAWYFEADNPNYFFNGPNSAPVCDETNVYFGGSDNHFYALDQQTGEMLWRFRVGKTAKSILSSPALHEGTLFFGAYDGNIYALDSTTGMPRWVNREADYIGSSPALAPELGLLFIGTEYATPGNRGAVQALSMETGESIWWSPVHEFLHGSPLYLEAHKQVAIGTNDGLVLLFDAESGAQLWAFDAGGEVKHSLAYDESRDLLFFGSFDQHIYGVARETGEPKMKHRTEGIVYATPLVCGDRLFCPSTDRKMYIIDLTTLEIAHKQHSFGKIFSSPALLNGMVFWGGNDGIFRGIDPNTLERKLWLRVAERLLSQPTYANGTYFISGAGATLFAFRPTEETS